MNILNILCSLLLALPLLFSPCLTLAAAPQKAQAAATEASAPAQDRAAPGHQVSQGLRGNPRSKIFHNASCRYYNSKGSSRTFSGSDEARAAGFRPCKVCGG